MYKATTEIGRLFENLWENGVYKVIEEVGGTIAVAIFVCSSIYYFIIGKTKTKKELSRSLMITSSIAILIIYCAPAIIKAIIQAISG